MLLRETVSFLSFAVFNDSSCLTGVDVTTTGDGDFLTLFCALFNFSVVAVDVGFEIVGGGVDVLDLTDFERLGGRAGG